MGSTVRPLLSQQGESALPLQGVWVMMARFGAVGIREIANKKERGLNRTKQEMAPFFGLWCGRR